MKHVHRVGDEVLATVKGFEPFPAVVENVLLNEAEGAVFYYVRFRGATKSVPLDPENLETIGKGTPKFKLKYTEKQLKRESKLRVDALLGAEDEVPEVLMSFVTVDSDFEEVSEETVKRLGLHSIMLTPSLVERLDESISPKNGKEKTGMVDDYVDADDVGFEEEEDEGALYVPFNMQKNYVSCAACKKNFKNQRGLSCHRRTASDIKCRLESKQKVTVGGRKDSLKIDDGSKKKEAIATVDRSKWASRSASGYYPCKLCFRKFKSKGEAQLHMSSHRPHARRVVEQPSPRNKRDVQESDDSFSIEDSVGDDMEAKSLHCSMERVRRAELSTKFSDLAVMVGLERGASKVSTLSMAKTKIAELQREARAQDLQLMYLRERNSTLRANHLALSPELL